MSGTVVLNNILDILTGGITTVSTSIGAGLSSLAQSIFLTSTGALSTFGILIVAFAGISLALGLCRLVYQFLTSLGSRNK